MNELLARIRAGDPEAFATVYRSLFDGLWRFAVLHTQAPDVAMEIVQDVFLHVWTHADTIRDDADLGVYLAVAVRNRALNLRKHTRVTQRVAQWVADDVERRAEDLDTVPALGIAAMAADARVEADDLAAAYQRAMAMLSEQERLAAYLRWEEGWSFERVGAALGLSKVGARKVVLRAQRTVQRLLAPYRE